MRNGEGKGLQSLESTNVGQNQNESPNEVVKIRRLLTLYLGSLIDFPDDTSSHLQLCLPENALEVKEIPKEVVGIRRQYLKEVRANIAARKQYDALLAQETTKEASKDGGSEVEGGSSKLATHLALLQMRRRRAELQITRQYFDRLRETNPAPNGQSGLKIRQNDDFHAPELPSVGSHDVGGTGHGDTTTALTRKLEMAVIRAKHRLDQEKRLLEEVKARNETNTSERPDSDQAARVQALAATRDELIRWLDEKLSQASTENDTVPTNGTDSHAEDVKVDHTELEEQIKSQYEKYIEARKRLLSIAATVTSEGPPQAPPESQKPPFDLKTEHSKTPLSTTQPKISPLPFISEQLLPQLRAQKSSLLQRSYTTKILKDERKNTLEALERLADESHLLPAYPIMARQERFRNAAAALGPRKLDNAMTSPSEDELVRRAEAWAFAAKEASFASGEFVAERVQFGNERLEGAQSNLVELEALLGRKGGDEEQGNREEDEEEDVWLEDMGERRPNTRKARRDQPEEGPWAGLNGRLGIADKV